MPADTYSAILGWLTMGTGNDNNTWGDNANQSIFLILEKAIAGRASNAVTGGTLDLTTVTPPAGPTSALEMIQNFTGTLVSNQIVQVPNLYKIWLVRNATSGSFTLKFKTPSGSASDAIPQGGWAFVFCDGSNNIFVGLSTSLRDVQWLGADGTVAAPGLSFSSEGSSGLYRKSAGVLGFSILGTEIFEIAASGVVVTGDLTFTGSFGAGDGSVSSPGLRFADETNTGFYRESAGKLSISILGTKVGHWDANGFTWLNATYAGSDLSPANIGSNQNNYNPASLAGASALRLNPTADVSITGLAGGAAGREITLENIGSFAISFPALSGSSSAANQFASAFSLMPGKNVVLRYDATSSLWRAKVSAQASPPPALYKNLSIKVATNTTVTVAADFVYVTDGTNFLSVVISSTLDLGSNGAVNRLDAGTIATGTWYSVWAIAKSDGSAGTLASTSATSPTLPTGYTFKARIGWVVTAAGVAQLMGTWQYNNKAHYVLGLAQTTVPPHILNNTLGSYNSNSPTLAAISLTAVVPSTAVSIHVIAGAQGSANIILAPSLSYSGTNNGPTGSNEIMAPIFMNASSVVNQSMQGWIMLEDVTQIYGTSNSSNVVVACYGWEDNI